MKYAAILPTAFFIFYAHLSHASTICGDLDNGGSGPFDYTSAQISHLRMVEMHHFSKEVEQLIAGVTSSIGADLDFTLRAYPNHHRALETLSRLTLRDKTPKPTGARHTTLCYFERAIRFKPDDAMVRMVFSNHLLKINKVNMALEQLLHAHNLEPENPLIAYNLGLIYLKQRNFEQAMIYAQKAYEQDFPLQGLKRQLVSAGKWRE